MLLTYQTVLLASLLGSMIFFPTVVAPAVFSSLPSKTAASFLRRMFPNYYLFIVTLSFLAACMSNSTNQIFFSSLFIGISSLFVRQVLLKKINQWRDAELAGDNKSGRSFQIAHRITVILNIGHIVLLVYAVGFNISLL